MDRRTMMTSVAGAAALYPLVGAGAASAQTPEEARLHSDWAWLGRYAEDNRRLLASGVGSSIVFLGDSITQGWRDKHPAFFTPGRIGRGIGGQTTPQMLVRMMADVVALKPRVLHLMGGTNDIAGNTGPMTLEQTQANLRAMCQLAHANGIAVLLASVPPAGNFAWRPRLETVAPIRAINGWSRREAQDLKATFVDYTPALATPEGAMRPGLSYDGVHPTEAGYDAMEKVLTPYLRRMGV